MAEYWFQEGNFPRSTIPAALAWEMNTKDGGIGVPAVRVYMALARRADNTTGRVDSTETQIAEDARMSLRQVSDGLKRLRDAGWVWQEKQGRTGRSSVHYVYADPSVNPHHAPVEPESTQHADIRVLEDADIRVLDPLARGYPQASTRISASPLVSSLLSTTYKGLHDQADESQEAEDGGMLGILFEAPEPKPAKPKRTTKAAAAGAKSEKPPYTDEFEAWWKSYPVRVDGKARSRGDKERAAKLWARVTKEVSAETLMAATRLYAADFQDRLKYVTLGDRWLDKRKWEGYTEAAEREVTGELTNEEIIALLGGDHDPLPPLPEGVSGLSAEGKQIREQQRQQRQADRLAKALAKKNMQTEAPRQDEIRSSA